MEVVESYARAVDRLALLRRTWAELGSLATALGGSTGAALIVHPLVKGIDAAEEHVRRLAAELGPTPAAARKVHGARRGRPRGVDPLTALGAPPPFRVVR